MNIKYKRFIQKVLVINFLVLLLLGFQIDRAAAVAYDDGTIEAALGLDTVTVPICSAGTSVSGTVYEADGTTPLNGATVEFREYETDAEMYQTTTDSSGNYSCDLSAAPGNYRISAGGGGYSKTYYNNTIYENATKVTVTISSTLSGANFVLDTPGVISEHLLFNFDDPQVAELAVRQAIAYGTDRQRMIDATWPDSPLRHSNVESLNWAYTLDGVPQYDYDPTMAESILTAAGWVDTDADYIRDKGGQPLHIDYVSFTSSTERIAIANIFVENMAAIGIDVTVTYDSGSAKLIAGNFDVYQFGWFIERNSNDYEGSFYHSTTGLNFGNYNNPTADGYLDSADAQSTRAGKLSYLHSHQVAIITDLAELPLLQRCQSPDTDCDGIADIVDTNAPTDDFIITVKTDNTGTSSTTQFTIPTAAGPTYNYNVDCNDDRLFEATGVTGDYTCDYSALGDAGTYTVRIQDNAGDGTGFPQIYFYNGGDRLKLLTIEQWGTGIWTSMQDAFHGCENLTSSATDAPDLSNVTTLYSMFYQANAFNADISSWDVSNVTSFVYMFYSADSFNQPLGSWDLSSADDLTYMFAHAVAFNQDLSGWTTTTVQYMYGLFYGATAFNQDISSWDTSNVSDMEYMFRGATSFDQNIGSWDVTSLTTANGMFQDAGLSTANYDALLIGWNAQTLQSGVPFGAGSSTYCSGEAARANMISSDSWTITDAGKNCGSTLGDYDGDGDTDIAIRRGGKWYIQGVGNFSWGIPSDIPVPGDYDGDGNVDAAVFRDGKWFIKDIGTFSYGIAGDIPVPADYDGDGTTEIAIRRGGKFYIMGIGNFGWGIPTDIPVPGDYDGDGAAEIAVFRDGKWFIKDIGTINYGIAGDIPVPADYDGDGTTEIAIRRGGKFYIMGIGNYGWGLATDVPVPGDYDGDGAAEIAVFRDGRWFIKDVGTINFGIAGDYPLPAPDTNADGDPYQ